MKKVLLAGVVISGLELFGMGKATYFEIVHEGISPITVKVSDGLRLLDASFNKVGELNISSEGEEDGFEVSMDDNVSSGTVSIYNNQNDTLLKFYIEKNSRYSPAVVDFLNIGNNTKAVLYRPSMGGGDRFVLAIGDKGADISMTKMQQSLPFGSIQFFSQVCKMESH